MVKFSRKEKEEFNKLWKELLENSFESVNKKDKKGRTILHYAVTVLDQRAVKLLIKKGADINASDVGQYRPLHLAVMEQRLWNTKELIRAGVEVNAAERHGKHTPLHFACMVGGVEIVKELVKAGGDAEQKDRFGKTPMYYAKNSKGVMEVLDNNIAKKQGEFLEKIKVERTVEGVIVVKKDLAEVDKELEKVKG